MRWILILINLGILALALYFITKYIVLPIAKYVQFHRKQQEKTKPKTREELARELELAEKKRKLDKMHFERSDELTDHLDSIFEEARRYQPGRRSERQ
jgi:hypothetical protein